MISRNLAFNMQHQTQSNWCWAAASTSVSLFYWAQSIWTQCKVACAELARTDCCGNAPAPCDVVWRLDLALTRTQNFVSLTSPIIFQQVCAQIDAGKVVCARIAWAGGGAHFVAIYGYNTINTVPYLAIDDSIYGKSLVTFADFQNHYRGTGTWTHTYYTKSYSSNMALIPLRLPDHVLRPLGEASSLLALSGGRAPVSLREEKATKMLGLAHAIYVFGLDELHLAEPRPARVGIRVLELEGGKPSAFFDFADMEQPNVKQMSDSAPYLQQLPRAMDEAFAAAPSAEQLPFELRLLSVPALNFEAIWLHTGNDLDQLGDRIVPFRSFHGFTAFKPMHYSEAIKQLQRAASGVPKQQDLDDLTGGGGPA